MLISIVTRTQAMRPDAYWPAGGELVGGALVAGASGALVAGAAASGALVAAGAVSVAVLAALLAAWHAPNPKAAAPASPRTVSFRSRLIVVPYPSPSFGGSGPSGRLHVRVINGRWAALFQRRRAAARVPPRRNCKAGTLQDKVFRKADTR
jgi:hypothetical protein